MELLDYLIVLSYFTFLVLIALFYSRKEEKNPVVTSYLGQSLSKYLASISMFATTFVVGIQLIDTELVANNGISGNWLYWNFIKKNIPIC